jgi:hypothetical protein
MKLTSNSAQIRFVKKFAFYACLSALLLLQGCNRLMKNELKFGSHQVSISRHGSSHDFYTDEQGGESSFHYKGYSLASGKFEVVIKNEQLIVNDKFLSQLGVGDSVNITDGGVTINPASDVETAKRLQTDSEPARP